jgi:hypothetical protein
VTVGLGWCGQGEARDGECAEEDFMDGFHFLWMVCTNVELDRRVVFLFKSERRGLLRGAPCVNDEAGRWRRMGF